MERFINLHLNQWLESKSHKPLLLRGARQVGKTFAVRNLGKKTPYFVEINCEVINCKSIFEKDLNPERILREHCVFRLIIILCMMAYIHIRSIVLRKL